MEDIKVIKIDNREFYLLPTAHVSKESVNKLIELTDNYKFDTICVELDIQRYNNIINPKRWEDTNIIDIIKNKQVSFLITNIILSSFQNRIAKHLDTKSGQEMITAIQIAKDGNIELNLIDRSIKVTFLRIWRKSSFIDKCKLIVSIINSIFDDSDISEEDINLLMKEDILQAALKDMGNTFPIIKEVLLDERDRYLAYKIKESKGDKILVVIGAAHYQGVINNLNIDDDIDELDIIGKGSFIGRVLPYIIPLFIILVVFFTLFNSLDAGIQQVQLWFIYNSLFSAIGAMLAGGHLLSIIVAFIVAPFTSLNPLVAAGWVVGIVEANIRKPKVVDFNTLSDAFSSIRLLYSNRITRLVLVIAFTNLFSTIATFISGYNILEIFFHIF